MKIRRILNASFGWAIIGLVIFALISSINPGGLAASLSQLIIVEGVRVSAAFSVLSVLVFLGAVIVRAGNLVAGNRPLLDPVNSWGIWALGGLFAVSIAGSFRELSIPAAQNTVVLAIFVTGMFLGLSPGLGDRVEKLLLVIAPMMAALSITEMIFDLNLVHNQQLAQMLPIAIVLFAFRLQQSIRLQEESRVRLALALGQFILLTGVFSTGQRTASVIAVLLSAIFATQTSYSLVRNSINYFLSVLLIGCYGLIYFLSAPSLSARFNEPSETILLGAEPILLPNSNGRFSVWASLLSEEHSLVTLLFGRGTGSAVTASAEISNPHSEYIRFFFDLGLFGLALWLAFLIWTIVFGIQALRRGLFEGVLAIGLGLTISMFSFTISILLYSDFALLSALFLGSVSRRFGPASKEPKP